MKIIEKAKSSFDKSTRVLEIKEWETKIYATPLTFREKLKIRELSKNEESIVDESLVSINTIIQKSLDKDGKNIFSSGDTHDLLNEVDPNVLVRILEFMMDSSSSVKEEKKD